MPLSSGTRLGPYDIQAAIGAGGMGEVYKARDTRLDRTVAIKVLPTEPSADPDRRARFEREAKVVAALSHPHICALFDIGQHVPSGPSSLAPCPLPLAPVHYLVMEYLQGETLANRLSRGKLPLNQALTIATAIADALAAAHRQGIVHRDLKPGNVMLTGGASGRSGVVSAKLLDFGLAKLAAHGERPALSTEASASTQMLPMTARGTIVGTLQYMAPEQLEGKEADARTDLWALGALLYEMVTGKRAFRADSDVSLIGAILNAEPPAITTLQPLTPPSLERLVKKCLAKHPDDRWDSAHDVADELRWITQSGASQPAISAEYPRRRRWLRRVALVTGGLGLFLLGVGGTWLWRPQSPPRPLARVTLDVRPAEALYGGVAMASIRQPTPGGSRTAFTWTPDGRSLVYVGLRDGVRQVYVRRIDAAEARPIEGTEGAQSPAVSADGHWVAFWARYAIRKAPLDGGPVAEVVPRVRPPWGLVWDDRGQLVFGNREDGCIWRVPLQGTPAAVTCRVEGEVSRILPCPLPGARVLLYTVRKRDYSWGDEEIVALTVATGEHKVLLKDATDARYVPTGHLVFLRRGVLFAVPFDAQRVELRGTPAAVLDSVVQALSGDNEADVTGAGQFAVASTGTLAWVPGAVVPYPQAALVAVDRRGGVTLLPAARRTYQAAVRLSPDGRRLAVTAVAVTEAGLWVSDLDRGTQSLVNRDGEFAVPLWSPDGQHIAFAWLKDGRRSLAVQPVDGGAPRVLAEGNIVPSSWTPDGRRILAVLNGTDIVSVTVEAGNARLEPLIRRPDNEFSGGRVFPALSPDGHWLAYVSTATGREELFIRPYPGSGPSQPVSPEGGTNPIWHPNGRELLFITPWSRSEPQRMMVADVATVPSLRLGRIRPLFKFDTRDLALDCAEVRCADVSPDGQRFYAIQFSTPPPAPVVTHINLIQNWFEELRGKVPGPPPK